MTTLAATSADTSVTGPYVLARINVTSAPGYMNFVPFVCYAYLTDAIRHVVHDLVDQIVDNVVENEAYTIAHEKGEL